MSLLVILTTGGTGGHIFPALAVAEALKKRLPDVHVLFAGGLYGPERELAAKANLEFYGLPVRGILGRGWKMVPALVAMFQGIVQAWRFLGRKRPDVVMGFGGYAAFAMVCAARLRGCPIGIHEQNTRPGLSNRLSSRLADRICLSLPDKHPFFPKNRSILTGNPIRADIAHSGGYPKIFPKKTDPSRMTLLVMGGSQGAHAINSLVVSLLAALRDAHISLLHQTGQRDLNRVREAYKSHGYSPEDTEAMVVPFIHDMAAAYASADLALCRAGATTLAELTVTGTPAVLIPFPFAAHDHQTDNAKTVVATGGAVMIAESELEERDMRTLILGLLARPEKLHVMSTAMRTMAQPDAADRVAGEIIRLALQNTIQAD